jgi:hypothetical protein
MDPKEQDVISKLVVAQETEKIGWNLKSPKGSCNFKAGCNSRIEKDWLEIQEAKEIGCNLRIQKRYVVISLLI